MSAYERYEPGSQYDPDRKSGCGWAVMLACCVVVGVVIGVVMGGVR